MYEVELKVELSQEEKDVLLGVFNKRGFPSKGVTPQNDFYVEAKESQFGGFDLKRYRNEAGTCIYTEKVWELIEGVQARKEEERIVSQEEFDSAVARFPDAIAIKKNREWFAGEYQGSEISITIDTVKFDHSPQERYFIEAEIGIEDKVDFLKTKEIIKNFLADILGKDEIIESPGMFSMAFKKL